MTFKEAIQKDGQRHLYVKSAITSGSIQHKSDTCSQIERSFRIFEEDEFAFPNCHIVAMRYLLLVAISVPSESLFSLTANIDTERWMAQSKLSN